MKKYEQISLLIQRRIERADYGSRSIPSARRLAQETGVSYMTALKALQHLVDNNCAVRTDNGRLEANPEQNGGTGKAPALRIAFLSYMKMNNYYVWENAVQRVAVELGCSFKLASYTHEDDPIITETISGNYDVVFLSHILRKDSGIWELVRRNREKIVTLFNDLTSEGIRCWDGPEPKDSAKLVRHLYDLGHRKFAGLTVCEESLSSQEKIAGWENGINELGLRMKEYRIKLQPYEFSLIPAYEYSLKLLKSKKFNETALFTPTIELATGFIRAMHDVGLQAGRDISVCSFGQPEHARMYIPSITIINRPYPIQQAREILQQYIAGRTDRLLFRPPYGEIIYGESTGPAPITSKDK